MIASEGRLRRNELIVRQYLQRALREFSRSLIAAQLIRRFALETPELFCHAGLSLLHEPDDSAGRRYLSLLLVRQPGLLPLLADPWRFSRGQCLELFQRLMAVDPTLDVRLAHCFPNRYGVVHEQALNPACCQRALHILDEASRGRRIVPMIGHLVDHHDRRISSKAALMIGKRVQDAAWAESQIKRRRDPRVRANAIESIWGLNTPDSKTLLWHCTRDTNNRVVGNAWFGLHQLQEDQAQAGIIAMSAHPQPEFRWTAAWVMGRTGAPSFFEILTAMLKDSNPGVRSAVVRALVGMAKKAQIDAEERAQPTVRDQPAAEGARTHITPRRYVTMRA